LNRITLVELDGFSTETAVLELLKKLIGSNMPGLAIAVMTSSSVLAFLEKDGSNSEALAKAERINLVPFSLDELTEVILAHICECDIDNHFTEQAKLDLENKIKLVWEEFPGLANIDSILRIMRYCFEDAALQSVSTIDDNVIEKAIRNTHPSVRLTDSIIEVPFSEFVRIKRSYADGQIKSCHIRTAVRDLMTYSHQMGIIGRPIWTDGGKEGATDKNNSIDLVYRDNNGNSVAVAIIIAGGLQQCEIKTESEEISSRIQAAEFADKVVILTDKDGHAQLEAPNERIDQRKLEEMKHFSNKYRNSEFTRDDSDKITSLARSINLC
jgi:hypothetical protein